MLSRIIKESAIAQLRNLLLESNRIVITCHLSPDGDAIGSSLGLCHVLRAIGKKVTVVTPDLMPKNLTFLPGSDSVVAFSRNHQRGTDLLNRANLIFCMDFNDPKRVDKMESALLSAPAPKVLIDHHLYPSDFCQIKISHPELSSTSILLFRVLCRLELFNEISKDAAECIYTGMMTDTGNFTYNSNDPDLYVVIAELIKKGIDKDRIYREACNTSSESRLKLNAYATYEKMDIFPEHHAAMITLTADELKKFNYQKGDTEALVNVPLSLPEVTYSVFLRDDIDYIKVSMRSKGDFPVNTICEKYFSGGGHKNAAGGEFNGTLDEAIAKFKTIMPEFDSFFN